MKDLASNVKVVKARSSAAISSNTTTAGDIIDLAGHHSAMFVLLSATLTDGSYAPLVQVSNDAGLADPVTLTGDDLIGTTAGASFAATDDNVVKKLGFKSKGYRYARLSIVSTGVTTGGTLGAVAVLGDANIEPVA